MGCFALLPPEPPAACLSFLSSLWSTPQADCGLVLEPSTEQAKLYPVATPVQLSDWRRTACGHFPLPYARAMNSRKQTRRKLARQRAAQALSFTACLAALMMLISCSGETSSEPAHGLAPSITAQPQSQTVAVGSSATFSVAATGTAPLSYQWQKNQVAIPGATLATYTTPATVSGDNGATFQVIVSNGVMPNATS